MPVTKKSARTQDTAPAPTGPVDLSSSGTPLAEDVPLQPVDLRGRFAVALCQAHRIGAGDGTVPCQDGLACSKKETCLDMADKTLAYARDLSRGRTPPGGPGEAH